MRFGGFITRLMDICLSIIFIVFLLPIFLLLMVLVKLDSKGPIFFKQSRIGKNGNVFSIIKFRTMIMNSEEVLKNNTALYKKYVENSYKLDPSEDPRVTKVGRFLRKTSLDEIPQFFNVLKGEMSLVGPRPILDDELKEYGKYAEKFLSVKPGITGYWQVSGRSDVGYPERVDLELYYVDRKSVFFDSYILLKTFIVVVKKKGAY
ncbi:Sugar transferase; probable phospho-glucosyltransferase [Priestia megaterium WSH-002]|uniref:Sugar transferase probable phospho-glucosyltransferase n=2 Tax=Priestia megaterium TaxID=1404 RepID=A0A8D3X209_PRIMW|nr:Sugar transferase; probable phospho-glucosyltransferase [Priestia megaterium WSH-002]